MKDRKLFLFNLPKANNSIGTVRFTGDVSSDAKEAAVRLQSKVDEVLERRQKLVDGISDDTMRRSLRKD